MAYLNKAEKRTSATDVIEIIRNNSELLRGQGYKPEALITELEQLFEEAKAAEARQLEAKVNLRNATIHAQKSAKQCLCESIRSYKYCNRPTGEKTLPCPPTKKAPALVKHVVYCSATFYYTSAAQNFNFISFP